MNDTIYFILIVIFTLFIFLFYSNYKIKCVNRDNFKNTDILDISDYIKSNVNILEERKDSINTMSKLPIIKEEPRYKYGLENHNLSKEMDLFNNQLDSLMDSTLLSSAKLKSNISENIKKIEENEKNLNADYVRDFQDLYKKQQENLKMNVLDKEFSKFYVNEKIDKHNEGFENNKATEIKNESNLSIFKGKYFILPYQYNNLNNVYMNLIDNNPNVKYSSDKIYLMSFHLLNIKFIEFEVTIDFKNETLFDEENNLIESTNPEFGDNIKGIIITIKPTKPKQLNNYKYLNTINQIKNLLKQLGIKPDSKLMFFLIDSKFESKTQCFLKKKECNFIDNALYRLYSIDGLTLLHLTKKSIVDKPFNSLIK